MSGAFLGLPADILVDENGVVQKHYMDPHSKSYSFERSGSVFKELKYLLLKKKLLNMSLNLKIHIV